MRTLFCETNEREAVKTSKKNRYFKMFLFTVIKVKKSLLIKKVVVAKLFDFSTKIKYQFLGK